MAPDQHEQRKMEGWSGGRKKQQEGLIRITPDQIQMSSKIKYMVFYGTKAHIK